MEYIYKYFKNSSTGQLICQITTISDVIKNIPIRYYNLHMQEIEDEIDLTGFVEIKKKKFDLYRCGRWKTSEINDFKSLTTIKY